MATQRTKLRVVVFICLGVLLFALGCILPNRTVYPNGLAPVRSLTLTMDRSQREELFEQLQRFSDKQTSKFVLTEYEQIDHFKIEIWGDDILITASDVPPDPSLVYIFFYGKNLGASVDEETVDELLNDLKSYINEIPNVMITEEN
jgi:hypothetical protein